MSASCPQFQCGFSFAIQLKRYCPKPPIEIIRRCADDIVERRRRDSSFQLGRDLRDVSALEACACEFIF